MQTFKLNNGVEIPVLGFGVFQIAPEQTAYYSQMKYIEPVYFHGTSLNAGYTEKDIQTKAQNHAQKILSVLKSLE